MSRRFQFRLKTLFWLTACALFAVTAEATDREPTPDEAASIKAIEKQGGSVWWTADAVFFRPGFTDAQLKEAHPHLRKLTTLRIMSLNFSRVSDESLELLEDLSQLQVLTAKVTRLTDRGLAHLRKMCWLKEVDLTLTSVTHLGATVLKEALPHAKVAHSGIGEPAREAEALRGTWRGRVVSLAGNEASRGERTLVIAGNDLALDLEIGRFTLDPAGNPRTIDVTVTDCLPGLNTPWSQYMGIYRLEQDTLTLCLSPVYGGRKERPTKFSVEGLHGWMYVFKRDKQ